MSSKIDAYLKSVTDNIKYVFIRQKIRQELKSHLEDAIVHYIEDGHSLDFATALALKDMGNPKSISDNFNAVYRSYYYLYYFLKKLSISLMFFIVPIILFPLLSRIYEVHFKSYDFDITEHLNIIHHQEMDETILVGNYELNFKDAYLTEESYLVVVYKDKKINPFISKHNTVRHIETCGTVDCFITNGIPLKSGDAMIMFPPNMGAIVIYDQDQIPTNIELEFIQLNNTHLTYTVEVNP